MNKLKIIAFYLPQFHPTPDNDRWWGKGFTEWTNVGKAKSLFPGHEQPKVPADLGYYDLRLPEIREEQTKLALEAGIYGFCYYHYWFGNGKEELELPFNEVLRLGKPVFPFMLCWANESWHKKFWDKDGKGSSKEILIEQSYPGEQDIINHFYRLLPAFRDDRYIKINGKIAFMIYRPDDCPHMDKYIEIWRNLAKKENLSGFHFIGHVSANIGKKLLEKYKNMGFDAVNTVGLESARDKSLKIMRKSLLKVFWRLKMPIIVNYKNIFPFFKTEIDHIPCVYPTLIPNWDHSPRSGRRAFIIKNSSPKLFAYHILDFLRIIEQKENPILFLKSWNEWGEGNYMEPDLKFGKEYIRTLKNTVEEFYNKSLL